MTGPIKRSEAWLYATLSGALIFAICSLWLWDPRYAASLPEYFVKFLPALSDGGAKAVFDTVGLGDPRPRLLANLLTLANVSIRQQEILSDWFHPASSVTWLLYPLGLLALYRAAFLLSASNRVAACTTLLYAASPAALDIFSNYYVTAKPLVNLALILSLYGGAKMFPARELDTPPQPRLGALLIGAALCCGLFSDETAVFAYLLLLACFGPALVKATRRTQIVFGAGVFGPLVLFGATAGFGLPWVNQALGQVPLDYVSVAAQGVHAAIFALPPDPTIGGIAGYSPLNLLETILSAHAVPHREVPGSWTFLASWSVTQWAAREQLALSVFLGVAASAWAASNTSRDRVAIRLLLTGGIFVLAQAFLLRPLAPVLLEVSYYAAPASLWFALIMGRVIGAPAAPGTLGSTRSLLLVYLVFVQASNYEATARRHPYWSNPEPSWQELRELRQEVLAGHFERIVQEIPFPDRRLLWAFEMEAARRSSSGENIDLSPRWDITKSIQAHLPARGYEDSHLKNGDKLPELDEPTARALTGSKPLSADELNAALLGKTLRGQSGPWRYIRTISATGEVEERIWLGGLVRQWLLLGVLQQNGTGLCVRYRSAPEECMVRAYRAANGTFFAFARDGAPVTRFRITND